MNLSEGIREMLADKRPHTLDEMINSLGKFISPEQAVRAYEIQDRRRLNDPILTKVRIGKRVVLRRILFSMRNRKQLMTYKAGETIYYVTTVQCRSDTEATHDLH